MKGLFVVYKSLWFVMHARFPQQPRSGISQNELSETKNIDCYSLSFVSYDKQMTPICVFLTPFYDTSSRSADSRDPTQAQEEETEVKFLVPLISNI
jgi:hypothetical protein